MTNANDRAPHGWPVMESYGRLQHPARVLDLDRRNCRWLLDRLERSGDHPPGSTATPYIVYGEDKGTTRAVAIPRTIGDGDELLAGLSYTASGQFDTPGEESTPCFRVTVQLLIAVPDEVDARAVTNSMLERFRGYDPDRALLDWCPIPGGVWVTTALAAGRR